MENPLEETGLLREGQAIELFNRRDYSASALVFTDVVEKVTGVERRHYYEGLLYLAQGYGAWDIADYGTALQRLREALKELDIGFSEPLLADRSELLVRRLKEHLSFLGRVRRKDLTVETVVDMVENARRRIADQKRFDDGVARLYRAVEMWHQWGLRERHNISTYDVDWSQVPDRVREQFLKTMEAERLPRALDLTKARALDKILRGDGREDDKVLLDLLQKRNHSILAHGLEPIGEQAALRFLKYVDGLVDAPEEVSSGATHVRLVGL